MVFPVGMRIVVSVWWKYIWKFDENIIERIFLPYTQRSCPSICLSILHAVSTLWLIGYFMEYIQIRHNYNTWGDDCVHIQGNRSVDKVMGHSNFCGWDRGILVDHQSAISSNHTLAEFHLSCKLNLSNWRSQCLCKLINGKYISCYYADCVCNIGLITFAFE